MDGDFIVIRNDGDFPVQLIARRTDDGHTTSPLTFISKATSRYASEMRKMHNSKLPGTMVLPGDRVRYEDGDNGASVRAAINVRDYADYQVAEIVSNFLPIVGQIDAFKDLVAELRDSQDQYDVCRSRPGLNGCFLKKEARQVTAIFTFALDVAPGRRGLWKLAKKIWNFLPARIGLQDPEIALNDYDTLLTQGPREPCLSGARLTILPMTGGTLPSMNVATAGQPYYQYFENRLYTSVITWGMSWSSDWAVSGAPGLYIAWTGDGGIGATHGYQVEVKGPATAAGSFTADLSATYRSRFTGQVCAVAHYTYPLVVAEPPQAP